MCAHLCACFCIYCQKMGLLSPRFQCAAYDSCVALRCVAHTTDNTNTKADTKHNNAATANAIVATATTAAAVAAAQYGST